MKDIIYFILILVIFFSCNTEKNQDLKNENQQLKTQLNNVYQSIKEKDSVMSEIDILLDSIEVSEKVIKIDLEKGTHYEDYQAKLRNINNYIIQTERKLAAMEENLNNSDVKNRFHSRMIKDLKEKLNDKQLLIDQLNNEVKRLFERMTAIQEDHRQEVTNKDSQIKLGKEKISQLEKNLIYIQKKAKEERSEAYFRQAQQEENLAKKIKFAPKKKKQHLKNAYALYKQSFEIGNNTKAYEKMLELENKVF